LAGETVAENCARRTTRGEFFRKIDEFLSEKRVRLSQKFIRLNQPDSFFRQPDDFLNEK
jgi:hypothetical protein